MFVILLNRRWLNIINYLINRSVGAERNKKKINREEQSRKVKEINKFQERLEGKIKTWSVYDFTSSSLVN